MGRKKKNALVVSIPPILFSAELADLTFYKKPTLDLRIKIMKFFLIEIDD